MSYLKLLSNDTKIRICSEIVIKVVNILIIPLITYGVGIKEYGNYIIITCIINGLLPIFLLGFNFSIIKKLATNQKIENDSAKVFNTIFLITFFSILIAVFTSLLSFFFFYSLIKVSLLIIIITYFSSIQLLLFEFLRSKKKSKVFSFFQTFDSLLLIIITFILFLFEQLSISILLKIIIFVKISCLVLITLFLIKTKLINIKYFLLDDKIYKNYIKVGFIFIILGISEWLINFSDKLILNNYLQPLELSVYFTAAMFSSILNSVGSIFWWDLFPRILVFKQQKDQKMIFSLIREKISLFSKSSFLIILILIIVSPIIQYLMLNSTFEINHYIYIVFFVSVFSHQLSTGWEFYCYVNNKEKTVLFNSIFWGLISFFLYIVLIPDYKINGALFSLAFSKIGYTLTLRKYCKLIGYSETIIKPNLYFKFISFALSLVIFLAIFNIKIFTHTLILNYFINIFITLISFYLLSKLFNKVFNNL